MNFSVLEEEGNVLVNSETKDPKFRKLLIYLNSNTNKLLESEGTCSGIFPGLGCTFFDFRSKDRVFEQLISSIQKKIEGFLGLNKGDLVPLLAPVQLTGIYKNRDDPWFFTDTSRIASLDVYLGLFNASYNKIVIEYIPGSHLQFHSKLYDDKWGYIEAGEDIDDSCSRIAVLEPGSVFICHQHTIRRAPRKYRSIKCLLVNFGFYHRKDTCLF